MTPNWKPGDRRPASDPMIRVDQAGEFGAIRIYAGQLAIMGDRHPVAREIAGMALQEEKHRAFFDAMMARRRVRPTIFAPLWNVAGFALGAVTAAIGPEAAMACTAAVETEIDKHYADQLVALGASDPELSDAIVEFQAEEVEHRDTALAHGAERAPAYPLMSAVIRAGCRIAIATAQRI
ncbi:demethoxyubiquinone hydroxylase family protein [Sphingomonas bacterium]|uniref:demethoxyubiquinone hydroxylase family protein n=1 Tax=Sphingomonas bacterium TaxID=1895847 RepID=UPI0015771636|nr:demethoxyubiquinone hydroxylase family protein [Sphingomonas bacterium]